MGRLFAPILLLVSFGWAQSGSGTLTGTIKDATGAPVPSARIKIVNTATGVSVETLSNEEGLYRAGSLVPAAYRVEVDLPGFDRLVALRRHRARSARPRPSTSLWPWARKPKP